MLHCELLVLILPGVFSSVPPLKSLYSLLKQATPHLSSECPLSPLNCSGRLLVFTYVYENIRRTKLVKIYVSSHYTRYLHRYIVHSLSL